MSNLPLPRPVLLEESPPDEIAVMEMKGTLRQTPGGWMCECHGTAPGYGATPDHAYHEWRRLLYAPYSYEDAYDDIQRFENRQEYGE